jgi:DNA polymerase III subunit delta
MKLAAAQIDAFLKRPPADMLVLLVYGPDAGLVQERAEQLCRTVLPDLADPFRVAELSGAVLKDDPGRLLDEAYALSLIGGRRLVRVRDTGDATAPAFDALLKDPKPCDTLVVVEAGDLDKKSKLRALTESAPRAAAIPCYVEEGPARGRTIATILQGFGLAIDTDAQTYLADILPSDRLAMRSELDKLATYAHGQSRVALADVLAVIGDAAASDLNEIAGATGEGDVKRLMTILDRLFEEATSGVAMIRAVQRHFLRLYLAATYFAAGDSVEFSMKKLKPPVFFKEERSFSRQLQKWKPERIVPVLEQLTTIEALLKKTGTPEQAVVSRTLLQIATMAGR